MRSQQEHAHRSEGEHDDCASFTLLNLSVAFYSLIINRKDSYTFIKSVLQHGVDDMEEYC